MRVKQNLVNYMVLNSIMTIFYNNNNNNNNNLKKTSSATAAKNGEIST